MTTPTHDGSLRNNISNLIHTITDTAIKLIKLVELEGRLAGYSLVRIIGLLFIGGLLIFTAWLALLSIIVVWLTSTHLNLILALFIVGIINIALFIPVIFLIKYFFQKLFFPATQKQIKNTTSDNITGVTL